MAMAAWSLTPPAGWSAYVPDDIETDWRTQIENPVWDGIGTELPEGADVRDIDWDYLPAWWEEWYGTDPGDPDTEGDGITDRDELEITGTDPRLWDTDENGNSDYDDWYGQYQPQPQPSPPALEIEFPNGVPMGYEGETYSIQPVCSNGEGTLSWAISYSEYAQHVWTVDSQTGEISGLLERIPEWYSSTGALFRIGVDVTDSNGNNGSAEILIPVHEAFQIYFESPPPRGMCRTFTVSPSTRPARRVIRPIGWRGDYTYGLSVDQEGTLSGYFTNGTGD